MKKLIIWIAVLFLISLAIRIGRTYEYKPGVAEPEDKLGALIEQLAICESGGLATALNPQDGGSRSVGVLQFKDQTFLHYAQRYTLFPNAEKEEILNFLWDADYQKLLARKMLEENPNNWTHWRICGSKVGLNKLALK